MKDKKQKIEKKENVVKEKLVADKKKKTSKTFLFISYTIIVEEPVDKDEEKTIRTIAKNLKAIREKLKAVYKGEIDDSKLVEAAMKGYVSGIGDKYTEYYTKDEWSGIKEDVSR